LGYRLGPLFHRRERTMTVSRSWLVHSCGNKFFWRSSCSRLHKVFRVSSRASGRFSAERLNSKGKKTCRSMAAATLLNRNVASFASGPLALDLGVDVQHERLLSLKMEVFAFWVWGAEPPRRAVFTAPIVRRFASRTPCTASSPPSPEAPRRGCGGRPRGR